MSRLILQDWPAPPQVGACITTREDGVSQAPWHSLNLVSGMIPPPWRKIAGVMALVHLPAYWRNIP